MIVAQPDPVLTLALCPIASAGAGPGQLQGFGWPVIFTLACQPVEGGHRLGRYLDQI